MTIINPGGSNNRWNDGRSTQAISTRERNRRIAVALAALSSIGAVVFIGASLSVPLVIAWIGYSRWRAADRGAGKGIAAAAMAVGVAGTALVAVVTPPAQSVFLVVGAISFVTSALAGLFTGFDALGALGHVFSALPFTEPVLFGLICGLVLSFLQNWRRSRLSAKTSDSLVGAALSGERWARSWLTVETFAVNVAAAYLTALLLDALGVFHTGGDVIGMTTEMWKIVTGGAGSGGGHDYFGIFLLIVMLLALAGALLGFGLIVGFCSGGPVGGISGILSWRQMVHSATAAATRSALTRRRGPWIFLAIMRGGFEGAVSSILTGWILAGLHLANLC